MEQSMIELKKAYDAKQNTQSKMGQLLKLSEECSELAAAINKYVEIETGLYECKSGPAKAWDHVIEEACDVATMMLNCKLTLNTVEDPAVGNAMITRMVYKAYRFIDRLDLFKQWMKSKNPTKRNSGHKKDTNAKNHKRRNQPVKLKRRDHGIDITVSIPRDYSGVCYSGNDNPWREGMEGDFE